MSSVREVAGVEGEQLRGRQHQSGQLRGERHESEASNINTSDIKADS